jgi:tRNA nucleotidyltransferase (CCA-adding enzyme)
VLVVDTQSIHSVRGMKPETPITFIDHHPLQRELQPHWDFKGDPVGANVTMLCEELQARDVTLTPLEATLMILGIFEDTGALLYGTTTSRDALAASWLLAQGAELDIVRKYLHMPLTDDQHGLFDTLLESVETVRVDGHTIAVATAPAPDLVEELSSVAHRLRDLLEPSALFIVVSLPKPDRVQLVARSTTDDVDVSRVAAHFGGGGHSRAAAALIRERSLEAVRIELMEVLPKAVRPSATVADLMSYGVQTVDTGETAHEVEARMRRTGHEGYPVIEGGQLVGLLTRHAVDRAIDHGRGETPARELMNSGAFTVRPDDPVDMVQRVMLDSGWGQVPVVAGENNELVGVVTRTDLIKRWGQHADEAAQRAETVARLEARLSPKAMQLVRRVSETAQAMEMGVYFVGGFVRDLLLEVPTKNDIDFVVEGDAIALVRQLRAGHGGQMRSHDRFGTAKWMLEGGAFDGAPDLPGAIDFVTARSEFYTHPSALPTVEGGSIKLDLHRRDFTINTLAIRLAPPPFGQLLDFWGGTRDLKRKIIRVLHSLSFVDDPTRVLRAARLEQRLGFAIEPRTRELIDSAVPLLDRVSGARIRHELEAIFDEDRPEAALRRLDELGVLAQLHPALRVDGWLERAFAALRRARDLPAWPALGAYARDWWELPHFILTTFRLDEDARRQVCKRLRVRRRTIDTIELAQHLRRELPALALRCRPSEAARRLDLMNNAALAAGWAAAEGETARDQIAHYAARLRDVRPLTTGDDLKARGLKPGPHFGDILDRLRDAWLDGEVNDAAGESALLARLLGELGEGGR